MPIRIGWRDAGKTCIYVQFVGFWNWDDFYEAVQRWSALAREIDYTLVTLANFADSQGVPSSAATHFNRIAQSTHPKFDQIVIVGADAVLESLSRVTLTMYPQVRARMSIVRSMREAEDAIDAYTPQPIKR